MIPQTFIDDLLSRVDVADVVGRHVKLRKAGANLQGLCPFHSEKTPSFTVSPIKQFYHCFGCGAHGTAIGFLMEHGGLGYVDAIEELAQSVGLTVPHEPGTAKRLTVSEAPNLIELLTSAARYYQRRLKESPQAIDYLKRRGLSGVTAGKYGLGFAPDGWRNLEAAVPDYNDESLVRAGLVKHSGDNETRSGSDAGHSTALQSSVADQYLENKQDHNQDHYIQDQNQSASGDSGRRRKRYDRFRNRVMFPIRNPRGGIIGFGGRVMDSSEPKYLNSPETPVFSKGRELYGLYEGRTALRELNQAIVVEGYMDVVMLAEHGVGNAVATLGTATTADHIRKLLRIVDTLVFCFDGDKAGQKAAWRALETCLPIVTDTQKVLFLFLPDGEDPDSYVKGHGADGFRAALDQALPLSAFMIEHLTVDGKLDSPEARARLLAQARPLLAAFGADGMRMQMTREIADLAGIGLIEFQQYLDKQVANSPAGASRSRAVTNHAEQPGGQRAVRQREPRRQLPVRAGLPSLERRLRLLMVCYPGLSTRITAELPDPAMLPPALVPWVGALSRLGVNSQLAATLDSLRSADLDNPGDLAGLERDLAADWGGVTQLDEEEATQEFLGALDQLRRRATGDAARRAASELQQVGLTDETGRRKLLDLLASQRRS